MNPRRVPWLSVIAAEGMVPFPDLAHPSSIGIQFRCAHFIGSAALDERAQMDRGMEGGEVRGRGGEHEGGSNSLQQFPPLLGLHG